MDAIAADLRFALRGLRRRPAFTAMVLATLALGIGANTALFSVLDAVLLRPLPYPEPERLVRVWPSAAEDPGSTTAFSLPDWEDWAQRNRTLQAIGLYSTTPSGQSITTDRGAFELETAYVTPGFFEALGTPPLLGRTVEPSDIEGDPRVVVLSHRSWTQRFAADPSIVGDDVTLKGRSFRVVGVMPPDFAFPESGTEIWVPVQVIPSSSIPMELRPVRFLEAVARLAPGTSIEQATADLSGIARALAEEHPDTNAWIGGALLRPLHATIVGDVRTSLLVLFAGVGILLLIGCVNVAHLLLARATARRQEIAIRGAMGAARGRLIRQLLTESLVLALLGGLAGVGLALAGVRWLVAGAGDLLPRGGEVAVDLRVLVFALAASLVTGLLFGLAPAWRISRHATHAAAGRRATSTRGGRGLVAFEVGVALILLVGAGLMVRTLDRLYRVDPGFDPAGLLAVELTISDARYPERSQYLAFYHEAMERFAALPGVEEVGSIRWLPLRRDGETLSYWLPDRPEPPPGQEPSARILQVSPGVMRALGVPLLEGRPLDESDRAPEAPVALVNQAFAREAFGGESPVGRSIATGAGEVALVGLVADIRQRALDEPAVPTLYLPQALSPRRGMTFLLRGGVDPLALAGDVRTVLQEIDPAQPITQISSMEQIVRDSVSRPRFLTTLLVGIASIALLLAGVGVYGVIAQQTARRVAELGVRTALGARRTTLLAMVVRQGMTPVVFGAALGLLAALVVTRWMESVLFEVAPADPATYAIAALTLIATALGATVIPALSATRVDPVAALRVDA
ncbi:MAG TPA: ABC transporter permease [Thermoanaerobaculia bacterium]|nr:ABC transporter permease [Thermoanaerobaculia bacterium]